MQLSITHGPRAAVEPSGQPSTARRWFSNWLVSAPSIVQWPELCTRGANSLASELAVDVEELDREHADVVELVEQAVRELFGARLQPVVEPRRRARGVTRRMPSLVHVLDDRPARDLTVEAADRDAPTARVERRRTLRG